MRVEAPAQHITFDGPRCGDETGDCPFLSYEWQSCELFDDYLVTIEPEQPWQEWAYQRCAKCLQYTAEKTRRCLAANPCH